MQKRTKRSTSCTDGAVPGSAFVSRESENRGLCSLEAQRVAGGLLYFIFSREVFDLFLHYVARVRKKEDDCEDILVEKQVDWDV